MSSKVSYMTQASFDNFKAELDELKTTGRQEAATAIAEAREKGDLSENAEYDAAKEAQGLLGKEVGDIAEVHTPRGKMEFEILDISINL